MARSLIVPLLLLFSVSGLAAEIFQYTEADNDGNNIALGYPVPRPADTGVPGNYFRHYDFLLARHQDIALGNAQVNGHIIGKTSSGEDIWAYLLGNDGSLTAEYGSPKGTILINGGIHAREWQSPESVSFLLEHLANIQEDNGVGRYIADNLNVVIVPVLNVDGFRQTQQFWNQATASEQTPRDGRMRRKNMNNGNSGIVDSNLDTAADNLLGVDLNRNSAEGFGRNGGSEGNLESLVYHGVTAASESEIVALHAAAELGLADQLRLFTDVHSFSQVYLVPRTGDAQRDAYTGELARRMGTSSPAVYGVLLERIGTPIGTTADYFAYTYRAPAWTLELEPGLEGAAQYGGAGVSHDGFMLPETEVSRLHADTLAMYMTGIYMQAGPPAVLGVDIRDAETGNVHYAAQWRHDSERTRTLVILADRALVEDAEYELRVVFDKPMVDTHTGRRARENSSQPSAELTLSSLGDQARVLATLNTGEPEWLEQAGEYHRYRGDTLRVRFRVSGDLLETDGDASRLALAIDAEDFAGTRLDADPATPANWGRGYWERHDRFPGDSSSGTGGIDCSYKPFIARDANATPPSVDAGNCFFWNDAKPADSGSNGSGGGGAAFALLLALLLTSTVRRVA